MNMLPDEACRTITADEVNGWVGKSLKPVLSGAQCEKIAKFLTGCRWPGDQPDPPDSPWLVRIIEDDQAPWCDFERVSEAARILHEAMPIIFSRREAKLRPEGKDEIRKLKEALSDAMKFIAWPFGQYERQTGQKTPKPWHTYALLIARALIDAMVEAGHKKPAISRNSVIVRVVQIALIKMKFPDTSMVTPTAIAAYLTRWDARYGLTPQGIAALTTKQMTSNRAIPS